MTPERFRDYDRARNGLQVESRGPVRKIAAAVDCTLATVRLTAAAGANLMVVHHGLFWSETRPWTGPRMELIRTLVDADMAVYSMHLPLDAHKTLGNAAQLARLVGLRRLKPFFRHEGECIGWQGETTLSREALGRRLGEILGRDPILLAGGASACRRVGICTGEPGPNSSKPPPRGWTPSSRARARTGRTPWLSKPASMCSMGALRHRDLRSPRLGGEVGRPVWIALGIHRSPERFVSGFLGEPEQGRGLGARIGGLENCA